MRSPEFNQIKFDELVLYVALRSVDDRRYGATKLNKILFYSDFVAYAKTGAPITGAEYRKLQHGPAPRQLKPAEARLTARGDAARTIRQSGPHIQKLLFACREPNLTVFTAEEISTVDYVMERLRSHNARSVSELSHQFRGWKLAALGETIPYFTTWIPNPSLPLTKEQLKYGQEVAARISAQCARS